MRGYSLGPAQGRIVLSGDKALPYKVLVDGQEYAAPTMRVAERLMRAHTPRWPAGALSQNKAGRARLRLVVNNG